MTKYLSATPILASLDLERSVNFFCGVLNFSKVHLLAGAYAIVQAGAVEVHFFACEDQYLSENTACRIQVSEINALYRLCQQHGVVHPNAPLETKPWHTCEFGILDPDGNLVTFYESV